LSLTEDDVKYKNTGLSNRRRVWPNSDASSGRKQTPNEHDCDDGGEKRED